MLKFYVIDNWSNKDEQQFIDWSQADGIGVCKPTKSLLYDLAMLEMDEDRTNPESDKYIGAELTSDVVEVFDTAVEFNEYADSPTWTDEVSEGGEI